MVYKAQGNYRDSLLNPCHPTCRHQTLVVGEVMPPLHRLPLFHDFLHHLRISLDHPKQYARRRIGLASASLPAFQSADGDAEAAGKFSRGLRDAVSDRLHPLGRQTARCAPGSATSPRFQATASRSPSNSASPNGVSLHLGPHRASPRSANSITAVSSTSIARGPSYKLDGATPAALLRFPTMNRITPR